MPIKYLGIATKFKGRTLLEIILNLKEFGKNRIVIKSSFQRYSEPCYYKILHASPLMDAELHYSTILVEEVFRGVLMPDVVDIGGIAYHPDFQLIHKHDETKYCQFNIIKKRSEVKLKALPGKIPFPILMKEYVLQQANLKQSYIEDNPMLKLQIKSGIRNLYYAAETDEETQNIEWKVNGGKNSSCYLYEDVNYREEVLS